MKQSAKLQGQLDAAHEAIDVLRRENVWLAAAARDILRFHDDCICRHARRFLARALGTATTTATPSTPAAHTGTEPHE